MPDNCVFCEIVKNDPHEQVISTMTVGTNTVKAFEPLNPCTEGHLLFVPCRHYVNASADAVATCDCVAAASLYAKWKGIDDYNIIINCGYEASQTIPHLHVHLVPRLAGDNLSLPWEQHQQQQES